MVSPPRTAAPGGVRRGVALGVLTAGVFTVGTAEYAMVGLLPELAEDLNATVPAAGSLVTWYALVVTLSGPLVTAALLRLPRRAALLGLTAVCALGNVLAAGAQSLATLAAARMLTALTHSAGFAVAVFLAVAMTPADRRGRAVAAVGAGWNLAGVLGAPLGTWLGGVHGWRTTFAAIAAVSLAVLAAAAIWVPHAPAGEGGALREVRGLLNRRAGLVLALFVVAQAGLFVLYTYITPVLAEVGGFTLTGVAVLLAVLGAAALAGNALGGRLAAYRPWRRLRWTLAATAVVLAVFGAANTAAWTAVAAVAALGLGFGTYLPLLQDRALAAAPGAPTLVSAAGASAVNLGIAAGSGLGGAALGAGATGLRGLGVIGAVLMAAALALTFLRRDRRAQPR